MTSREPLQVLLDRTPRTKEQAAQECLPLAPIEVGAQPSSCAVTHFDWLFRLEKQTFYYALYRLGDLEHLDESERWWREEPYLNSALVIFSTRSGDRGLQPIWVARSAIGLGWFHVPRVLKTQQGLFLVVTAGVPGTLGSTWEEYYVWRDENWTQPDEELVWEAVRKGLPPGHELPGVRWIDLRNMNAHFLLQAQCAECRFICARVSLSFEHGRFVPKDVSYSEKECTGWPNRGDPADAR